MRIEAFNDLLPVKFMPMFSGMTEAGEKVVLYTECSRESLGVFHIRVGESELIALPADGKMDWGEDLERFMYYIQVESSVWTGQAKGSKYDLIDEPGIRG